MTDSVILAVGIFAFVMALTGVVLTVVEFRRTVLPEAEPTDSGRTINTPHSMSEQTR